ncbi:MAG: hypothetical protein HY717_11815 [Planctomycetes bacterium]|nr:hypothetical protein [Planctomycetota bacterium]
MLDKPVTPAKTLARARQIGLKTGLRYVYTGNILHEEGSSTCCHECGNRLIGRFGYDITEWNLTAAGNCSACGTPCAGVFEAKPGTWGSRRLPVMLSHFAGSRRVG